MYAHYGCGLTAPPTWRNFDTSPTLRLRRIPVLGRLMRPMLPAWPDHAEVGDIVRGLPLADGSCDGIYCSHMLEHLALADFRAALRNTYRLLKPGGVFRLVVPNLEAAIRQYVESDRPDAAIVFLSSGTLLGTEERPRALPARLRALWGNSRHLWMWDYKALAFELEKVGFRDIRRARFGDSLVAAFADVEEASRWHAECSIGIECGTSAHSIA